MVFPCQTTRGSLLKPPVQFCRAGPFTNCADTDAPDSPFYSPSTHGESQRSRFPDAAAPSSRHLQSSYHRIPVEKKRTSKEEQPVELQLRLASGGKALCVVLHQRVNGEFTLDLWVEGNMCNVNVGVLGVCRKEANWCKPGGRKNQHVVSSPFGCLCLNHSVFRPF